MEPTEESTALEVKPLEIEMRTIELPLTPEPEEKVMLFPEADRMPLFWANLMAKEKIVIDQGGMYSGKTEAIMRVLFAFAILRPNTIIHVVANSIPKLREDSMKVAERIYRTNQIVRFFLLGDINKSEREYTFRNGSTITFKSYETAEEAEGAKRDVLYINEGRRISWGVAYLLIKRTNLKVFIDYNPVASFWAHDELINCPAGLNGKKEFPSVKVIRSWHIHNKFIPDEKHEEVENIADPEMWKAYARGLTAKLTGLVYPGCVKLPKGFIDSAPEVIWGIDLGFTNDPTVIVKCAMNYKGYDYIFQSFGYAPGIPTGDMANIMKLQGGYKFGQPCYMDHNVAVRRELRQLRIVAIHAFKPKGSVYQGILHLRTKKVGFIQEDGNLLEYGLEYELRRHSFVIGKDGKPTNEPEHQYSHGPSAMRYAAYTHAVRHGAIRKDGEEQTSDEEVEGNEGGAPE